MTSQAYVDNIYKTTGKTPDDFRKLAEKKGLLKPGVKAQARRLGDLMSATLLGP